MHCVSNAPKAGTAQPLAWMFSEEALSEAFGQQGTCLLLQGGKFTPRVFWHCTAEKTVPYSAHPTHTLHSLKILQLNSSCHWPDPIREKGLGWWDGPGCLQLGDLSLTPRTHKVGQTNSCKFSCERHACAMARAPPPHKWIKSVIEQLKRSPGLVLFLHEGCLLYKSGCFLCIHGGGTWRREI